MALVGARRPASWAGLVAVLLATGCGDSRSPPFGETANAEIYDPVEDRWTPAGAISVPRGFSAGLIVGGRPLVLGGDGDDESDAVDEFDPLTGMWTTTPSLLGYRAAGVATVLSDGRPWIGFGERNLLGTPVSEIGDVEENWVASDPPEVADTPTFAAIAALDGGHLVVGGASDPNRPPTRSGLVLVWFLGDDGTLREGTPLPSPRLRHTASELPDGRVLVVGGTEEPSAVAYHPPRPRLEPRET